MASQAEAVLLGVKSKAELHWSFDIALSCGLANRRIRTQKSRALRSGFEADAGSFPCSTSIQKGTDSLRALFFLCFPKEARLCAAGGRQPKCSKSATFSGRVVFILRLACGYSPGRSALTCRLITEGQSNLPTDFSFRIRIDRSPTDTIEVAEPELALVKLVESCRVSLNNKTSGQPLREAQHFVLLGTGYTTEVEATKAGEFYEVVLMVALARVRVGVDFGYRAAKGSFTSGGLKLLEHQHGQRMINDVHGLMVYTAEPKPQFALAKAKMLRGASKDSFLLAFAAAENAQPVMDDRERLAFSLFNASFFQPTADSRFLLLVMSIEALIDPALRSAESQSHVKSLIAATKAALIPPQERESMLGAIRWLQRESINQAGRRLVEGRLGTRQYNGRSASDFFTHVYQMRSNLVHGNLPYPTFEMVGAVAAPLEVFVSELLTGPIIGLPEQAP